MGAFKNWIFESTTADSMLAQLADDFQARYEQPEGFNASNSHTLLRLVAADALDDDDRTDESALLRDLTQHVVVVDGKVYKGSFFYRYAWNGRLTINQIVEMREDTNRLSRFIKRVDPGGESYHSFGKLGVPNFYNIQGHTGYFNEKLHVDGYRLLIDRYTRYAQLVHSREGALPY